MTVYPPANNAGSSSSVPRLSISLVQGSFFSIMPILEDKASAEDITPQWYAGNIYDMGAAPPQIVDFPIPPSLSGPTTYDIFVSGDYEVRQTVFIAL